MNCLTALVLVGLSTLAKAQLSCDQCLIAASKTDFMIKLFSNQDFYTHLSI